MSKTLVIIPTYNEEQNIVKLVENIFSLDLSADILVVDDGNDNASTLVGEKQKIYNNLFLIKRTGKLGRGSAVLEGLKFGLKNGYDFFVEMDADFSHQTDILPSMIEKAVPDSVVIGSRYIKGGQILNWPLSRRIFSKLANIYAQMILRINIKDYTTGYRVYSREAAEKLDFADFNTSGYAVLSEIAYQLFRKGVVFIEYPIIFANRKHGNSNFCLKEIYEAFFAVIKIRKRYKSL